MYHVVFTPKYRMMPDHVHMLISIPPKYSVAEVIGYLKGKSSMLWGCLHKM